MNKSTILRIARPTDNLNQIVEMYCQGLGFIVLAKFKNHENFDGVMLGHPNHLWHLEFTHHRGTTVGRAPTQDNLLAFYIPSHSEWLHQTSLMKTAGFIDVPSYNPYWDVQGKTFEDIDGYRVVLQNTASPV
ncbi:VOC family protein [Photorhabdus heterorhabditis]|uniref:Glyoxalase n=1 Tax=Photorhabdus heterorhabditis TaxID=880156 RepID=A0A5B0X9T7_9GAMM|nr:VOC family protein [Photorhabdus heterorhabditis]KAA1194919.1 VOC family protein [Photorhabdus heterorhabditis]KOY60738.1 glyoxalase [Photorhabdus heterorhabditis]MBS9442319.1 VOC family protein [Photorhabdus heterorhabditis]